MDWPLRNNYVSVDLFLTEMGLLEITDFSAIGANISIEQYVYYVEFILNMVLFVDNNNETGYGKHILDNVVNVLGPLNYTIHFEDEKQVHVIQKDILVSEAAEIVQDSYELGESIYSFNYRELKGNLNGKSDIICRLYKYIESITSSAKQYGYSTLLEDIKDLSNKLDVRHTTNDKQEEVINSMGKDEYESWLDELFNLSLSLIVLVDYTSKRKDIKELKSRLG